MCNAFLPRKTQFIAYGLRVYAIILVCPNVCQNAIFHSLISSRHYNETRNYIFTGLLSSVLFGKETKYFDPVSID